jgi:hypothetical protein
MLSFRPRPFSSKLAALALFGMLIAGCAAPQAAMPTAAPAPTSASAVPATTSAPDAAPAAPAADSDAEILASIQQSLDLYAQAYNKNKPELLKQAADQTNAPFRRFIQARFDTFQKSINAGQQGSYEAKSILKKLDLGFVLAQVESGGGVADWTFREVDGRWVMSEPTERQLGKREQVEGEHFVYFVYPWAKDANAKIMELMEAARSNAEQKLGKVPDTKPDVYVRPIFGAGGIASANVLAYYDSHSRDGDQIVVYTPDSYVFGFYDSSAGWESKLEWVLTHEYTHLANNRAFTPIARMSDWMFEGLAEFVAGNRRAGEVSLAVRSDQIIPIKDTSGVVNKQDLEHLTILVKDVSLAYGLSASLVEHIVETHGGMDGWWKLVGAYDTSQSLDKALQQAYGIGYDEFDQGWRAWLKQKYG